MAELEQARIAWMHANAGADMPADEQLLGWWHRRRDPSSLVQRVAGQCPMGCGRTLFLGEGGHVTCSLIGCPRPTAADELLHLPTGHFVVLDEQGFTLEHPTRERIEGTMHNCPVHVQLRALDGAAMKPGRYEVRGDGKAPLVFAEMRDV